MAKGIAEVRFGGEQQESLILSVAGRAYHHSKDYWDGNWLLVKAAVQTQHFTATVPGLLRAEELSAFSLNLQTFYQTLTEPVDFSTMENWLTLFIESDKLGHVRVSGTVSDNFGLPNRLEFVMLTDQTFLPATVSQLQHVVQTYPVIGKP